MTYSRIGLYFIILFQRCFYAISKKQVVGFISGAATSPKAISGRTRPRIFSSCGICMRSLIPMALCTAVNEDEHYTCAMALC